MAKQERKSKPAARTESRDEIRDMAPQDAEAQDIYRREQQSRVAAGVAELFDDDLLEVIDSVLEDNAEEFVRQFVQKGGE